MATDTRKPWLLNGQGVAEWLGVTPKTVSVRNFPSVGQDGRSILYDIREILRLETARGLHALRGEDEGEIIDHEAEKARLTKARRVSQELDNLERVGAVAPVELFGAAFDGFCNQVVQTLEGIPGDVRRADPEISARSIELIEAKIASFRNLASDKCVALRADLAALENVGAVDA